MAGQGSRLDQYVHGVASSLRLLLPSTFAFRIVYNEEKTDAFFFCVKIEKKSTRAEQTKWKCRRHVWRAYEFPRCTIEAQTKINNRIRQASDQLLPDPESAV